MTASSLWSRLVAVWILAAALLLLAAPTPAAAALNPAAAAAVGGVAGALLFVCLGGRRVAGLALPHPVTSLVLVLAAAAEEIVWRWFALAELAARVGAAPALVATTAAFSLAHRHAVGQHLLTGAAFGGLYLATGSLAAAWCAHAVFNLCVAAARTADSP